MNAMRTAFARYERLLRTDPYKTKTASAITLLVVGDVVSQNLVERRREFDWRRLRNFAMMGFIVAPSLHVWYRFLNANLTSPVAKMACDQLLYGPPFIAFMLSLGAVLNGEDPKEKLQNDYLDTVQTNWILWVPFQFFNFRYVKKDYQVLASNSMGLVWNCYLSYKINNDSKRKNVVAVSSEEEEQEEEKSF